MSRPKNYIFSQLSVLLQPRCQPPSESELLSLCARRYHFWKPNSRDDRLGEWCRFAYAFTDASDLNKLIEDVPKSGKMWRSRACQQYSSYPCQACVGHGQSGSCGNALCHKGSSFQSEKVRTAVWLALKLLGMQAPWLGKPCLREDDG